VLTAYLGDLKCLDVPKVSVLPYYVDRGVFIDIYDWDLLLLGTSSESVLLSRIVLCSGPLPCALTLKGVGSPGGILKMAGGASFACLGIYGCNFLSISSVQIDCGAKEISSAFPPIEIEGALLMLSNSVVKRSFSETDGGCVKSYNGAIVRVGIF
jgi:hypothetical protein